MAFSSGPNSSVWSNLLLCTHIFSVKEKKQKSEKRKREDESGETQKKKKKVAKE